MRGGDTDLNIGWLRIEVILNNLVDYNRKYLLRIKTDQRISEIAVQRLFTISLDNLRTDNVGLSLHQFVCSTTILAAVEHFRPHSFYAYYRWESNVKTELQTTSESNLSYVLDMDLLSVMFIMKFYNICKLIEDEEERSVILGGRHILRDQISTIGV